MDARLRAFIQDRVRHGCLTVRDRRLAIALSEAADLDVWICESCGDTREEGLSCYAVRRSTRRTGSWVRCFCSPCAVRIPHDEILSD